MEILEIHKEQLMEYRSFLLRGLKEHPENFRISVEDEWNAPFPTQSRPDSFTLAAIQDGKFIGVVSFEREGENRIKIRHKGLLFRMYVAQEFSGKGVGKALIHELLEKAKKLPNMEQVNLTVVTTNLAAKSLYGKFGFKTYGIEKNAHKTGNLYADEESMVRFF